jgi:pimeloyl-ACP methyl ester carboxylesterase
MSELIYDVAGAGPAVLLLHGQPGSRDDWARLTRRLTGDFTVIAPDRPGYGDSGGRARGFRGNAAAMVGLLDQLEVERAIVVGYSWAGGVALALAEEAPARVAALVLVSSICPGEPLGRLDRMLAVPPIGTAVVAAGLYVASGVVSIPPVRHALQRRNHSESRGSDITGPGAVSPDTGSAGRAEGADSEGAAGRADSEGTAGRADGAGAAGGAGPAGGNAGRNGHRSAGSDGDGPAPHTVITSWRSNRVWQSFVTEQRCLVDELPALAAGLGSITAPTVVLVGDADRMVPPANGRRLARTVPGARLIELRGAGHLLAHQHPDEVAAAIGAVTRA